MYGSNTPYLVRMPILYEYNSMAARPHPVRKASESERYCRFMCCRLQVARTRFALGLNLKRADRYGKRLPLSWRWLPVGGTAGQVWGIGGFERLAAAAQPAADSMHGAPCSRYERVLADGSGLASEFINHSSLFARSHS